MQTFLPYADFENSAKVLDYRRLGKQRGEALQILYALTIPNYGWPLNHPAIKMWAGYERALAQYGIVICEDWLGRGYEDNTLIKIQEFLGRGRIKYPPWLGNRRFHISHRSNLIRKFPEYYRRYWPKLRSDLEYVWPK